MTSIYAAQQFISEARLHLLNTMWTDSQPIALVLLLYIHAAQNKVTSNYWSTHTQPIQHDSLAWMVCNESEKKKMEIGLQHRIPKLGGGAPV